jgi:hypothetical protein
VVPAYWVIDHHDPPVWGVTVPLVSNGPPVTWPSAPAGSRFGTWVPYWYTRKLPGNGSPTSKNQHNVSASQVWPFATTSVPAMATSQPRFSTRRVGDLVHDAVRSCTAFGVYRAGEEREDDERHGDPRVPRPVARARGGLHAYRVFTHRQSGSAYGCCASLWKYRLSVAPSARNPWLSTAPAGHDHHWSVTPPLPSTLFHR